MSTQRFEILFDQDAYKEYVKLDHSVAEMVDRAFEELEAHADQIGKDLKNNQFTKLHGCKEIKLKKAGIRIVFKITGEKVEVLRIVYILAIEKRTDNLVFQIAHARLRSVKSKDLNTLLISAKKWQEKPPKK